MLVCQADLRFLATAAESSGEQLRPVLRLQRSQYSSRENVQFSCLLLTLAALYNGGGWGILVAHGGLCGRALAAWAVIELLFWAWSRLRYATVNAFVDFPIDGQRAILIKQRFLSLAAFMSIEDFISGWFMGQPYEVIRRGNVEDFVAYGFYCQRMEQLPAKYQEEVREFVRAVEVTWGRSVPDGRNPEISFMAHLLEPLRTWHTPLCVHMISEVAAIICHVFLSWQGFRKLHYQGMSYWLRLEGSRSAPNGGTSSQQAVPLSSSVHLRGDSVSSVSESDAAQRRPLVFIHGVGLGLFPYLGFLLQIFHANPNTPVVLLDVPHVALRFGRRAKSVDTIAAAAQGILSVHGLPPACFAGHSFGTFCVSRICQLFPDSVHSVVLVDPVCCLTCYPQLLYNFVYNDTISIQEALRSVLGLSNVLRYIISRDLIIAETFCRQFLWHELMLWPEDMPPRAVVSVSANDDLVPAELVLQHFKTSSSPATLMFHPTAGHGGFLLDGPYQKRLIGHIQEMLQ